MKRISTIITMLAATFASSAHLSAANPTNAPFGSWRSPISAQMLVQGAVRFGDMAIGGDTLYWVETRPEEQGRYVVVRRTPDGKISDVLPAPFSARTTVHEYGGGAIAASKGTVFFTNYADQRLWRLTPGQAPKPITAEGKLRFADFVMDRALNRLIAICEDHTANDHNPINRVVAVSLEGGKVTTLVDGADFYSNPRISPDGRQLSWLSWNHPNMPWDGTELFVAALKADGHLGVPRKVAGGAEAPDNGADLVNPRVVHDQTGGLVHLDPRAVGHYVTDEGDPLLGSEQRGLAPAAGHHNGDLRADLERSIQYVQMAYGNGVEGSGVDGSEHEVPRA